MRVVHPQLDLALALRPGRSRRDRVRGDLPLEVLQVHIDLREDRQGALGVLELPVYREWNVSRAGRVRGGGDLLVQLGACIVRAEQYVYVEMEQQGAETKV